MLFIVLKTFFRRTEVINITKCLATILTETELNELSNQFLRDLYEQIHLKTKKIDKKHILHNIK